MKSVGKIVPFLWFDHQAEEAAELYVSLFENAELGDITRYTGEGLELHDKPEGAVMTVNFSVDGQPFIALNGGPHFRFSPAASLFITCDSEEEVERIWQALRPGGRELMPLGAYDWSPKYGWLEDRFGLSWQVYLGTYNDVGQKITPCLLFTGDQAGRAAAAMGRYEEIFGDLKSDGVLFYRPGEGAPEGYVKHAQFALRGGKFMVMDSPNGDAFGFTEAVSFQIPCETQAEVDHFWHRLSDGGEEGRCCWLKDAFGISWQVVPAVLPKLLSDPDRAAAVTKALLSMQKADIACLEAAE